MRLWFFAALLSMAPLQSCDLRELLGTTPERIRQRTELALRPYFPSAVASIDPNQQALLAVTCSDLGEPALVMLKKVLDEKSEIRQLKQYRNLVGLRSFDLGFQRYLLNLDLASGSYRTISSSSRLGYANDFAKACSPPPPQPSTLPSLTSIFVGRFEVIVESTQGDREIVEIYDTMGIYRDEDFERLKESEIASRKQVISSQLPPLGRKLVDVRLLSVNRIPFPKLD
jgi:hypothetical protein